MKLMASTKIVPDDEIIQGVYQELFTRGDIAAMKRLHVIRGGRTVANALRAKDLDLSLEDLEWKMGKFRVRTATQPSGGIEE